MKNHDLTIFFLQIITLLSFSILFSNLMKKLKQPPLIGELITGIFLGPTILGFFFPEIYYNLFQSSAEACIALDGLIKFGTLIFLFVLGAEINLKQIYSKRFKIMSISLWGIFIPFLISFLTVLKWPEIWCVSPKNIILMAAFIGVALSLSSIPVVGKILEDLKILNSNIGRTIMASATVDDLIGCLAVSIIFGSNMNETFTINNFIKAIFIFLFIFFPIIVIIKNRKSSLKNLSSIYEKTVGTVIIGILVATILFILLGFEYMFAAFLLGSLTYDHFQKNKAQYLNFHNMASYFFMPLYFASIGLKINLISNFDFTLVGIVLLIACIGKIIGVTIGSLLSKIKMKEAIMISVGMNARGAMGIIIASSALNIRLINEKIFVALSLVALITSVCSSVILRFLVKYDK